MNLNWELQDWHKIYRLHPYSLLDASIIVAKEGKIFLPCLDQISEMHENQLKAPGNITVLTFKCVKPSLFLTERTNTNPEGEWAREAEGGDDAPTDVGVVQLKRHHKTDGSSRMVPSTVHSPAVINQDSRRQTEREETMERRPPPPPSPFLLQFNQCKTQKRFNGRISLGHPGFATLKTLRFTHFFSFHHHHYR